MIHNSVLLVIANEGFQHVEYQVPRDIIARTGFTVKTASNKKGPAVAKDGSNAIVDYTLDEVNIDNFHGIFFIGGPGTLDALDNELSYDIIRRAMHARLPLGAICIASHILANAGALHGKHATGWNGDGKLEELLTNHGAMYVRQNVVVDGNVITAVGPQAAEEFGNQIVSMLQDNKGWG
jgi:protease I